MSALSALKNYLARAAHRTSERASCFHRNTFGGVAAVVAILSPVAIGGIGLGGEAGYWYLTQRKVQNAADVAAHGAAKRLADGAEQDTLEAVAAFLAESANIPADAANITVNTPPLTGIYIEDNGAVEIIITETVPRMFSAMYSTDPVPVVARAVATAESGGQGCAIALSETASGAVTIADFAAVNLILCDIVSNASGSSIEMTSPSSFVTASCVHATGTASVTANLITDCDTLRENRAPLADPYASVTEPAATGSCADGAVSNATLSPTEAHASGMSAMRFCSGLTLSGAVTLSPGLYIVEGGDLTVSPGAFVSGTGVTFYLADGANLSIDPFATFNVAAPASGTYNQIAVFGSRASTGVSHTVSGSFGSVIDGAVYTPTAHIEMTGAVSTSFTGCTQLIGDTITFSGTAFSNLHCLFPTGPVAEIAGTVAVVE